MRGLKEEAMVDLFKLNMDFCETIRWDRKTGSRQPDEMIDQYLLKVETLISVIAPAAAHTQRAAMQDDIQISEHGWRKHRSAELVIKSSVAAHHTAALEAQERAAKADRDGKEIIIQ